MKAWLIFILKLALTGLCLWWAFSQVDRSVFSGRFDPWWLLGGVALAGVSMGLHGLRWWLFLRAQDLPVSMGRAFELTLIDCLFSLASVSGLGGDAVRIMLLMRDLPGRKLVITLAVTADHLAGMVSLGLFFFAVSVARFEALADPSVLGRGVIQFAWFYLGGGLALVALIFFCASPFGHRLIHGKEERFKRWPILTRVPHIYDVYRRKWPYALGGVIVSFGMLVAYFSAFYCGLRSAGGNAHYVDVLSAMPVIDAISGMPVSIGGIGVREKLFQVLLHDLAGVPAATAIAASLAGFACQVVWAGVGAVLLLRKRAAGSELTAASD